MGRKTKNSSPSILEFLSRDFPTVRLHSTVDEVYQMFRKTGLRHKIIYLYVVDGEDRLLGVLPVRRLLVSAPEVKVSELYIPKCQTLSTAATEKEARDAFAKHKFLAFPVVDGEGKFLGVIDIERFAGDLGDVTARSDFHNIYELFGVESQLSLEHSPFKRFIKRLPWLSVTFVTGILAALLTGYFETTLSEAIAVAFFMTLVLGLNESVAMQSATIAVFRLNGRQPSFQNLVKALTGEVMSAVCLALVCGAVASGIVGFWKGDLLLSQLLGVSLFFTLVVSCLWGAGIPYLLHTIEKDPKLAAGPLVLGLSDLSTLGIYFTLARFFYGGIS